MKGLQRTSRRKIHLQQENQQKALKRNQHMKQRTNQNELGFKLKKNTLARICYYKLKEIRNQVARKAYEQKNAKAGSKFAEELNRKGCEDLFFVVAYNTPWSISLMISCWENSCTAEELVVIDNSNCAESSRQILNICRQHKISYFKLPWNREKHPNRSHGLALNWIWKNIVTRLEGVERIGFIDHDCFPVKPWSNKHICELSSVYGIKNPGCIANKHYWSLWAGFMFFKLNRIKEDCLNKMDFTPNPLFGLDTGGSNWKSLYSKMNLNEIAFANIVSIPLEKLGKGIGINEAAEVEIIDTTFLHLGGAAYQKIWKTALSPDKVSDLVNKLIHQDSSVLEEYLKQGKSKAGK